MKVIPYFFSKSKQWSTQVVVPGLSANGISHDNR